MVAEYNGVDSHIRDNRHENYCYLTWSNFILQLTNIKSIKTALIIMEETRMKKSWERKECEGCKSYNPECRQGACSIYLYKAGYKTKKILPLKETSDTS